MTTAVIETDTSDIRERATQLESQLMALRQQLQSLLRGTGGLQVILPECTTRPVGASTP